MRVPKYREPTHPGEMLLEEFLRPMNITQRELADAIYLPCQHVNELINKKRGVTPSTALRLSEFFGTSPGFWMNLQIRFELFKTQATEREDVCQEYEALAARSLKVKPIRALRGRKKTGMTTDELMRLPRDTD